MPRRYARKKRKPAPRRRTYKRRVPRNLGTLSGLPTQRTAKMKYVQSVSLVSATGIIQAVRFRANGIFDPNYETGGHQPFGYDTWATMYNHYVVNGAKITIRLMDTSGTYVPTVIGVYLADDSSTGYTKWTTYMEANRGSSRMLPPNQTKSLSVSGFYSARKFFNITDIKDNVSRIGAGIGSDPSENAIWHVWIQAQDLVSTTPAVRGTATIEYNVTFSEPKDLAPS